jgi:alkaline phosphatase D
MSSIQFHDRALASLSRRQLMNAAWMLGLAAVMPVAVSRQVWANPVFKNYPFTMGVASGDPLPSGVVLWTRLAPEPLNGGGMPMANVEVEWEVAAERAFTNIVRKGVGIARPELGHSVHVEVEGLEPSRDYFYRFRVGREVSQIGRTRTAPPFNAPVDRLRFGLVGCNNYEAGYFTAYRRAAEENFDFMFHYGDYIYEGRDHGGRVDAAVRRHHGDEIYTLVDYRNRYAQYKTDPDFIAAHASAPFIVSWDDHEVDNNQAGPIDENDTPSEVYLLRRAAAYQAYYESMPLRRAQWPRGSDLTLHRRLKFGNLIDMSVLDTRQYRSDQPCGDGSKTGCDERLDPSRTMLGAEQEAWLFNNLASASGRWTVLAQQVPIYQRDFIKAAPAGQFSMDKWDAYPVARDRLQRKLVETRAPNPIALSGDVHLHYGADLKLNYDDPRSPAIGTEFTATSISSNGDGSDVAPAWEPMKADNPHIKYHSSRRGYVAITATPATMRADFKILDKVTERGAPAKTGGSLVVEAGQTGAKVA